jgi:hypothetical protein
MSKYKPLWQHLQADGRQSLQLTFEEVRAILGFEIDHSFLTCKKEAKGYGYEAGKISLKEKYITFKKLV